jgi:cation diffusion facilitator family transporter
MPVLQSARQNFRLQFWITLLGVVLLGAKLVAYYYTHSVAVLSDALESIVNVVAGFTGLYSLYVAAKPRDAEHPYGHGKAEFVSAAIEGTLISIAGITIVYETVRSFYRQQEVHQLDTGLWIVGLTAVINYAAGYVCLRTGKRNNSLALQASGKHLQTDTLSTIGIIAGLVIMLFTGWLWVDKVVALLISGVILYNGYTIIRASLAGIMDEADEALLKKMIAVLNAQRRENWTDLHNLRVIKYGSLLHIDCHLTVPWYLNVHEAHREIDALTKLISEDFAASVEFFVHTDGCLPLSCPICYKMHCPVRQHPFHHRVEWMLENVVSNEKHTVI